MLFSEIINKKKYGDKLTREEFDFFITGYLRGELPDYQASAFLMAIWFQGLDSRETLDLTLSMAYSGDIIDLSGIPGIKADKHSTGGVSDSTTLVALPLFAACGGRAAKMSGRGLGHTGGTLDKLDSIPGFNVSQSMKDFVRIVSETGLAVIGQSENLVPADKKLYALRDVTGTVDNVSLIASSIMSKKIASGSDVIVLDIKTGNGAFMKKISQAVKLAEIMTDIGRLAGKKTVGIVTDMNQPLGSAVGNALEVAEAAEILQGLHESDLKAVSFTLAAHMLIAAGICSSESEAMDKVDDAHKTGKGLVKLAKMIKAQGGNPDSVYDTSLLPSAERKISITADKKGYIADIDTYGVGLSAMLLGAGRKRKEEKIDHGAGILLKKRRGSFVDKGEELAVFHFNQEKNPEDAVNVFKSSYNIASEQPDELPLIYAVIDGN